MNNLKAYLNTIYYSYGIKNKQKVILEIIILIISNITISFVSLNLLYEPYGDSRTLIFKSTLFMLFLFEINIIYFKIKSIIFGREVVFLKKLGFNNYELLFIIIYKLKNHFFVFIGLYAFLYWSAYKLSFTGLIYSFLASILIFVLSTLLVLIYIAIYSKWLAMLKNILILYIFSSFIIIIVKTLDMGNTIQNNIIYVMFAISELNFVNFISSKICQINIIPVCLVVILLSLFFKVFIKNLFYLDKTKTINFLATDKYVSKTNIYKGSPFLSLLSRDLRYIFVNPTYIFVQLLFLIIGISINLQISEIEFSFNIIYFSALSILNSLLLQNLYTIDSAFIPLYKMLPLKFFDFLWIRTVSTLIYSYIIPFILLLIELILAKINFKEYMFLNLIIAIIILVLALYFSGIILYFFPHVKKITDIPLIIGIFMILFPPVVIFFIFVGLKKGNKNWREWELDIRDNRNQKNLCK